MTSRRRWKVRCSTACSAWRRATRRMPGRGSWPPAGFNIPTLIVCLRLPAQRPKYPRPSTATSRTCSPPPVALSFGKVTAEPRCARWTATSRSLAPACAPAWATANTMHIVTEALGMALPGSTPVLANSPTHVGRGGPCRRPHRRHGGGGPEAARHHDPGGLRQCGQGDAGDQQLDQRGEAPGGDGAGIPACKTSTSTACSRPTPTPSPR